MRSAINYMLDVGRDCDVVIGIAVVFQSGTQFHVFTDNYKQAEQVNRKGAIVSYMLTACANDQCTWLLRVEQENLNGNQRKPA